MWCVARVTCLVAILISKYCGTSPYGHLTRKVTSPLRSPCVGQLRVERSRKKSGHVVNGAILFHRLHRTDAKPIKLGDVVPWNANICLKRDLS